MDSNIELKNFAVNCLRVVKSALVSQFADLDDHTCSLDMTGSEGRGFLFWGPIWGSFSQTFSAIKCGFLSKFPLTFFLGVEVGSSNISFCSNAVNLLSVKTGTCHSSLHVT